MLEPKLKWRTSTLNLPVAYEKDTTIESDSKQKISWWNRTESGSSRTNREIEAPKYLDPRTFYLTFIYINILFLQRCKTIPKSIALPTSRLYMFVSCDILSFDIFPRHYRDAFLAPCSLNIKKSKLEQKHMFHHTNSWSSPHWSQKKTW